MKAVITDMKSKARQFGQICLSIMGFWTPALEAMFDGERLYSDDDGTICNLNEAPESWLEKISAFEEENDAYVYHVIHTFSWFGECLSLLYVTPEDLAEDEDEGTYLGMYGRNDLFRVFSYVINLDIPEYSEYGFIYVCSETGGLVRVDTDSRRLNMLLRGMSGKDIEMNSFCLDAGEIYDYYKGWMALCHITQINCDAIYLAEAEFELNDVFDPVVITYPSEQRFAYSFPFRGKLGMLVNEIPKDADADAFKKVLRERNKMIYASES